MKKQIEQVQQYFKDKLLMGEFNAVCFEASYTVVEIEGYEFCLWNGVLGSVYCKPWNSIGRSFMVLPEFTQDESITLYGHLSKMIEANAEKIRLDKIAKLTEELNKLKS